MNWEVIAQELSLPLLVSFFLKENKYLLYHNDSHIVMTSKLDLPIPDASIY